MGRRQQMGAVPPEAREAHRARAGSLTAEAAPPAEAASEPVERLSPGEAEARAEVRAAALQPEEQPAPQSRMQPSTAT